VSGFLASDSSNACGFISSRNPIVPSGSDRMLNLAAQPPRRHGQRRSIIGLPSGSNIGVLSSVSILRRWIVEPMMRLSTSGCVRSAWPLITAIRLEHARRLSAPTLPSELTS
jgi:hypothetical protein